MSCSKQTSFHFVIELVVIGHSLKQLNQKAHPLGLMTNQKYCLFAEAVCYLTMDQENCPTRQVLMADYFQTGQLKIVTAVHSCRKKLKQSENRQWNLRLMAHARELAELVLILKPGPPCERDCPNMLEVCVKKAVSLDLSNKAQGFHSLKTT